MPLLEFDERLEDDWLTLGANIPDPSNYEGRPGWDYDYAIATDALGGLGGTMYGVRSWGDGSDEVGAWDDVSFTPAPIPKGAGSGKTGIPLGAIAPYQGWGQHAPAGSSPMMVNPSLSSASLLPGLGGGSSKLGGMLSNVNWVEIAIGAALAGAVGLLVLRK